MVMKDTPIPRLNHVSFILSEYALCYMYPIGHDEVHIFVSIQGRVPGIASGEMKSCLLERIQIGLKEAVECGQLRSMTTSALPPTAGLTIAFWDIVHIADLLSPKDVPDLRDTALVAAQMRVHH
ncbi:hypothetical protein K493DRAFT_362503 [Basidiobolus meristosporus CBS 931.73]|uniref:Squalene epoxidase domain-containing protein n=1 Tax=Basidiobolus meristosporus CBS 931.73 TaxID=1314790 RepID=A0A1Y1X2S2_9FUNG|nr:hypothetical protein K493DRAFT_362503 [Basidiobolus meristosporus CBS 931.73]|eukprot:ORX79696.1 hypothetical protein K493DRAFT_362503 [Basidiobolus meristosporus CBS 931.73]